MSKTFSRETLAKFEDASAGIPLRQLTRAFEAAGIVAGEDPGGVEGARKVQFRRYVAGVRQSDARQLAQLGDALGAMVAEVATSKIEFLVKAAESDGFSFVDCAFRPAQTTAQSFALTSDKEFASIDDRAKRLEILAKNDPQGALAAASILCESLCRIVLQSLAEPLPRKTDLLALADATIDALHVKPAPASAAQLATFIAGDAKRPAAATFVRLQIEVAIAFARYVVAAYRELQ